MIDIRINDEYYEIPEYFSIEQWQRLIKWDFAREQHWPKLIEVVTGVNANMIAQAPTETLEVIIVFIAQAMNQRQQCEISDFNEMTFGQFVDMDVYLTQGIDKHINECMQVLDIKPANVAEALWAIDEYTKYRQYIYRSYARLFGIDEYSDDDEDAPRGDVARAWYSVIVGLANDDVLKIDAVTSQPLKKILNFMALQKERALARQAEALKQKRDYDIQRNRR